MAIITYLEAQQFMGVAGSTKLLWIVNGANAFAESYCERSFAMATYTEVLEANPYQEDFRLSNFPLDREVISLVDESDDEIDITAYDYDAGIITITAAFWQAFPVIEERSQFFEVEYQAGYSTIPDDLKLAVLSIVNDRYNTGDSQIVSERLGDRSYRRSAEGIPLQAQQTLNLYKKGS